MMLLSRFFSNEIQSFLKTSVRRDFEFLQESSSGKFVWLFNRKNFRAVFRGLVRGHFQELFHYIKSGFILQNW